MFAFLDVGSVTGDNRGLAINENAGSLRSSVGVGVSWISPVGPLRLAIAKPIKKFEGDKIQTMQFQIGTTF
jgi:outer membrane protein insertion porin family